MLGALANFLSDKTKYKSSFDDYQMLVSRNEKGEITIDRQKFEEVLNKDSRLLDHYTPNPFASLIVNSIDKAPKNVLDPCCGLANILYGISNTIEADLTGVEINKGVTSIAQYLVPECAIVNADFFQFFTETKYDLIIGTLPSGPSIDFQGKRIKIEEAFVKRSIELLEKGGEAFFVVSYDFISSSYDDNNKGIVSYLSSITTLPKLEKSNSNLNKYLIHLIKDESENISFGKVHTLSDLKPTIKENLILTIPKSELENRLQPEYYISRHSNKYDFLDDFETKSLPELAQIIRGARIKNEERLTEGKFLYLKPSEIKGGNINLNDKSCFLESIKDSKNMRAIAQPGDILISTFFNQSKIYVVKENDPSILVSDNLVILRGNQNDYLKVYLNTEDGKKVFNLQAEDLSTGSVIPSLSLSSLKKIQIPIVPLANLNNLGDKFLESADQKELEKLKAQIQSYQEELAKKDEKLDFYQGFKEIFEDRQEKILEELEKVNKKLDTLLQELINLQEDFSRIKNNNRDEEEKIIQMLSSMDRRINSVLDEKRQTIEEYEEITKNWLFYWEQLHPSSKGFLPMAEYLYDELSRLQNPDYSPFILQYCRTLENEILFKLFHHYHNDGLKDQDIKELTAYDIANRTKAMKFAQQVKKNNCKYPLGDMHWILNLLKATGETYENSPLLQHFKGFISKYFEEELTSKKFLDQIQRIQQDFRNKAAHVSTLDLRSADECRELLRESLNRFFELKIENIN